MFRIGIIGTENSHAAALAKLFQEDSAFADLELVALGGDYPESNQKMREEFGVDLIAERPEDMLGHVDAVMITARDGARHAAFDQQSFFDQRYSDLYDYCNIMNTSHVSDS